jgi:hypothetical protein
MWKLRSLEWSLQRTTHAVGPVAARLVRDVVVTSHVTGRAIFSRIARALPPTKRGFEAGLRASVAG